MRIVGGQVEFGDSSADVVETNSGVGILIKEQGDVLFVLLRDIPFQHDDVIVAVGVRIGQHRLDGGSEHGDVCIVRSENHRHRKTRIDV